MLHPYDPLLEKPGLQRVVEEYVSGKNVVLIAPTGYGKTILSTKLVRIAREKGISAGLIHVVPYRALVRQIYEEKFKHVYPSVGYQSMDELGQDKSPYYLRELVVTTLDSFVYNMYRIPVAEAFKVIEGKKTHGHYYPVLASILTSTVVFDEAHMYLGAESITGKEDERESLEFIMAALEYLSSIDVPIIVETATMHSSIASKVTSILARGRETTIIYVGDQNTQVKNILKLLSNYPGKVKVEVVYDPDFYEKHSFDWKTKFVQEDDALRMVQEVCNSEPVLVVRNTVARAIETHRKLADTCRSVLVHSLLSNFDREKALKEAQKVFSKAGIIVATQVIEAGVEVNARILITDPAPIENLSQRAGRLCRERYGKMFEECRNPNRGAEIYVIKGEPEKLSEVYNKDRVRDLLTKLSVELQHGEKRVDWRLLSARSYGKISFTEILESTISPKIKEPAESYTVAKYFLESDATPKTLLSILERLNMWLSRASVLVNVLIPPYKERKIDELEIVTVDALRLINHELNSKEKCLEYENDYPKVVLVGYMGDKLTYVESRLVKSLDELYRLAFAGTRNLKRLIDGLTSYVAHPKISPLHGIASIYFIARTDCYRRGEGLGLHSFR
jgi:CRISPR-associated endonuclease/helicase Cas3